MVTPPPAEGRAAPRTGAVIATVAALLVLVVGGALATTMILQGSGDPSADGDLGAPGGSRSTATQDGPEPNRPGPTGTGQASTPTQPTQPTPPSDERFEPAPRDREYCRRLDRLTNDPDFGAIGQLSPVRLQRLVRLVSQVEEVADPEMRPSLTDVRESFEAVALVVRRFGVSSVADLDAAVVQEKLASGSISQADIRLLGRTVKQMRGARVERAGNTITGDYAQRCLGG